MIEVAVGLVFRDGRLLITQRRTQDHLGGLWEFPGGKREPTESYEECLHRELREELGIEIKVLELAAAVQHTYPERTVRLQFYRCAWMSGEPRALECQAFSWVRASQLSQFTFPAADAQLLQQLSNRPEWWEANGGG